MVWQSVTMIGIGSLLIYLGIRKKMEPALLIPMGFGTILVNLPGSGAAGVINHLFRIGIDGHELFPLLLFIGIGAMIDFGPLLQNPKLMLLGASAQGGSSSLCGWQVCWGSLQTIPHPLPSLARLTVQHPSMLPRRWNPVISAPSWCLRIRIWLWSRSSSLRSSACLQRKRNAGSGCATPTELCPGCQKYCFPSWLRWRLD